MNYLLHPLRTHAEWKERQRNKCVVTIDNPPMRIKGKPYPNKTDDPNFPTYIAFFGIRYAAPPIGPLRFQPPQPLQAKMSQCTIPLKKAYQTIHASLQHGAEEGQFYGSEDCLYLNIYMSKKPEEIKERLPVLVFIHGGGFDHGSGDIVHVEPDAIVRQNLILVTVNYRLGLLGFLNMGTEDCRGNTGLKDQVQALKWIKANIDRFGGDPYNVTLTGHSAGATCVNLHMISPLSEGLFHKAIVNAGGIYCPWGYQGTEAQHKLRMLLAQAYGLENELQFSLVQALMREDSLGLLNITNRIVSNMIRMNPTGMLVLSGPSKEAFPTDAFIPCEVEELMARAKPVPLIAGLVEQEGYMYILARWCNYRAGFGTLIKRDLEFVQFLQQNFHWSYETAVSLKDTLRDIYFPNLLLMSTQEIQDQLATFCTDISFRRFYDNFRIGQPTSPYFVYKLWYIAQHDQYRWTDCKKRKLRLVAPTHGDELNYLYDVTYLKSVSGGTIPPGMRHVMDHMCSLWGNFCKSGLPTSDVEPDVKWTPHTENEPNYLNIGIRSTVRPSRLHEARWRELTNIVDVASREE